jgi:8-oxo-dGTP diphosphatase
MTDEQKGLHVVSVAALVMRGNRVLAMRRAASNLAGPGLWETLSGRIEQGEEPRSAIEREIAEECGLEVELEVRPFEAYAATRRGHPMIVILYRAQYVGGEVCISPEHDEYGWLTAEEFAARSTLAPLVAVVRRALGEPVPENEDA